MLTIFDYLISTLKYLATMRLADVLDILVVAFLIYKFIGLVRKTNSSNIAMGVAFVVVAFLLSEFFKLTVVNFILKKAFELGLISLVILFQPELRRVLERVGSGRFMRFFSTDLPAYNMETVIMQTVLACCDMAKSKTGALIVFERNNQLKGQVNTGTIVDAEVTSELLKNIFYPKAPLHDGAAIIQSCRIMAAGCMLPLSSNTNLSRDLGMRHRAGIGMSEQSDAVVVIVSEETGSISVAVDGMLKRHLNKATFEKILRHELMPQEEESESASVMKITNFGKVKDWMKGKNHENHD